MVPVLKPNISVRLCGDYKITPQLEVAQHPLPTYNQMFSKLGASTVLFKVDLCNAFQQLELDSESKNVCTVNPSKVCLG